MSLFQSTVMPDLKEPSDTTGVRKMGLDLLAKINQIWDRGGTYDTGFNANGSWVRWNNGVMQCWGNVAISATAFTVSLPQEFVDSSYRVSTQLVGSAPATADHSVLTAKTKISFTLSYLRNESPNTMDWTAIGRWK